MVEFYDNQSFEQYEKSHGIRFTALIEDLKLYDLKDKNIADFGCGYGSIFKRLPKENNNLLIGFDNANIRDKIDNSIFTYLQSDLNLPFARRFLSSYQLQFDIGFCFETLEHLTNPYNCLIEIKKLITEGGFLYISIPDETLTHNTLYPGLFYPAENFEEFLIQMALPPVWKAIHHTNFIQRVYITKNCPWTSSIMKFPKMEEKFKNISPLEAVNL